MSIVSRPARKSTSPAFRAGPPVAPRREAFRARPFGQGILRSLPAHRLDCTISDHEWWAEECRREEDRVIDRMYQQFRAQERIDAGLDA